MRTKNQIAAFVMLAFLLVISGCGSADGGADKEAVQTIHVQVPFDKIPEPYFVALDQMYTDAAADFQTLNPNIKVIIDYTPMSSYTVKDAIKRLKSEQPPDILPLPSTYMSEADNDGLLWDLLQLQKMSSAEIDMYKPIVDASSLNGKMLVLPYAAYPNVVLYNKAFFDAAQIPYPEEDWTWEQFRDISKKLKQGGGSVLTYDPFTFNLLMGSAGNSLLSPEGDTAAGFLDSPEAVRTLQWLNGYYRDDQQRTAALSYGDAFNQFNTEQTGMVVSNYSSYTIFAKALGEKLGVAPLPSFAGIKGANPIFFDSFAISQGSKHPVAAWKFLEYLFLTKNENTLALSEQYLLTSQSVSQQSGQSADPAKSVFVEEMNRFAPSAANYSPYFYDAWTPQLVADFQTLLEAKDGELQARLHTLAQRYDQELARLRSESMQQENTPSQ